MLDPRDLIQSFLPGLTDGGSMRKSRFTEKVLCSAGVVRRIVAVGQPPVYAERENRAQSAGDWTTITRRSRALSTGTCAA